MCINERILHLIELKGFNKNSFCLKIGIKPQTLHHIIAGRKTKPSFNVIKKILSTFVDINAEWLITGSGKPIVKKLHKINSGNEQKCEFDILYSECKCRDYKFVEMEKKIHDLKQQITELKKDKEDLRTTLKILGAKFNDNSC